MSTHTRTDIGESGTAPAVGDGTLAPSAALPGRPGVPFSRTLQAEVRKMVDTRAGRWMVIVMAALTVVILAAFVIWGPADDATFANLLQVATLPLALLLPVIGIMAATAEWTQRTGLVTFTLEPRRGRVVLAKALGAAWPSASWSWPSPSRPPRSPTSRRHGHVGPRRRSRRWTRARAADLRPAGRRVRAALPQHARSPSSPCWSCRPPGASRRRSSAPSPTSAGGSTWTRSPVRCSRATWRAATGPSSARGSASGCCCRWRSAPGGCSPAR